VQLSGIWGDV